MQLFICNWGHIHNYYDYKNLTILTIYKHFNCIIVVAIAIIIMSIVWGGCLMRLLP